MTVDGTCDQMTLANRKDGRAAATRNRSMIGREGSLVIGSRVRALTG
jgi:hypothetical protein